MIKHIVMWKLKDFAEGAGREENARRMKEAIEALKDSIEQIIHLEVGLNFNSSQVAYDVALYSEFASKEDLQIYQQHPDHLRIANSLTRKVTLDRKIVDYEL
jgi:hypothetical protein